MLMFMPDQAAKPPSASFQPCTPAPPMPAWAVALQADSDLAGPPPIVSAMPTSTPSHGRNFASDRMAVSSADEAPMLGHPAAPGNHTSADRRVQPFDDLR